MAGATEQILSEAINGFYLAQPAPTVSELYRDITNRCATAGVPVPARTTVARRIARLGRLRVARRRAGAVTAKATTMRAGRYEVDRPNAVWQIDHSPADVIVVDSGTRQSIGRP